MESARVRPSYPGLQLHGPDMDAAAPGITIPLKVCKYRSEHTIFSDGFPSFNLDKKSFPAASSTFPLNSLWPEQHPLLNQSTAKSNGIAMDGLPNHSPSLWDAPFHQWPVYQWAQMMKQFYYFTLTNRMLGEKQYLHGIKFIVSSVGSDALILKGF